MKVHLDKVIELENLGKVVRIFGNKIEVLVFFRFSVFYLS